MTQAEPAANVEPVDRGEAANETRTEVLSPHQVPRSGNIYLRQPPREAQAERLGRLARLLGLEFYSDRLLTRRVRTELSILALILSVVFLFELAAWSFFFNGLFLGDVTRFHLGWTLASTILGLFFAGVILYFERQVITTDTWRLKRPQKFLAQGIRFGSILVGGFIVAHAVELLTFGEPVERTLYSKAVGREVESLESDLDGLAVITEESHRKELTDDLGNIRQRIEGAQQRGEQSAGDLARSREQVRSWEEEVRRQRSALTSADRRRGEVEEDGNLAALQAARNEVESAQRRYEDAQSHHRAATAVHQAEQATLQQTDRSLQSLFDEEAMLRVQRSSLSDETGARQRAIETLRSRLRDWEEDLVGRSGRGDRTEKWPGLQSASAEEKLLWPERWRRPLEFQEPDWHFFERIAMVYELAWGGQSGQSTPGGNSSQLSVRLDSGGPSDGKWLSRIYRTAFLAIHLAAMFVPFLVFAVKWFLMPKEVDAYYSAWHQAYAGDPEARVVLSVEEKVRKRGGLW